MSNEAEKLKIQAQVAENTAAVTELALKNKQQANEAINQSDLQAHEKRKAKALLQSDKEVVKVAEEVGQNDMQDAHVLEMYRQQGREDVINQYNEERKKDLKNNFMDALGFFLPAIIGGGIGYAAEGARGAKYGIDTGMKYGTAYADYKLKQQQAAAKGTKKNKVDITANFVTESGEPVHSRETDSGVEYFKAGGQVVDLTKEKIIPMQTYAQIPKEKRLKQQFNETMALKKLEKGELSQKQTESRAGYSTALNSIKRISGLLDEKDIGPVMGRVNSMREFFGAAPKKFTKIKAEVKAARLAYQKATSGLQVNQAEIQMIEDIIPTDTDAPATFKAKLEAFRDIVEEHQNSLLMAIESGQPMKMEVIRKIRERVKNVDPVAAMNSAQREKFNSWSKEKQKAYIEYKRRGK